MVTKTETKGGKGSHNNKLTQCFDDIMKVAAEMLVQQQLKTIKLDPRTTHGFTQTQYRSLRDKVHLFHSIMDDLDSTLTTSSEYLDTVTQSAVEKKKLQQQQQEEEEAARRKQLQEEEEEKRRKQEQQLQKNTPTEPQQRLNQTPIDLTAPTPGSLLNDFDSNTNENGSASNFASEFSNLNDMDLSMFGGIEQDDFNMNDFNTTSATSNISRNNASSASNASMRTANNMNDGRNNADKSSSDGNGISNNSITNNSNGSNNNNNSINNTVNSDNGKNNNNNNSNASNNSNNNNGNNNPDSYLTLNDFNDLGIDWNATGDPGDLDINDFNI